VAYGGGTVLVYDGMTLEANYTVPDVAPVVTPRAMAFGNAIVWRGEVYTVGGVEYVVPAATQSSLYAVYTREGALRALNVPTGEEYVVYPDELRPLYAVHGYDRLLIAAITPSNNLAVIDWPVGGTPQLSAYTVEPEAVAGYNPVHEEFYVKADGRLYRATLEALLLVSEWEPIYWERSYVYLYSAGNLAVYNIMTRETAAVVELPRHEKPEAAFGYPSLVVSYPGESHVYYVGPLPYAVIRAAPYTYALETYTFEVATDYNYTILIDGAPGDTTWVFTDPGTHTVKVIVSNGVVTREYTFTVEVYPRPLHVSIHVLDPPEPMGSMTVLVAARDTLDGGNATVPVTVWVEGRPYNGTAGVPLEVPVGWVESRAIEVRAVAGGGAYDVVERVVSVPVAPATAEPILHYLGGGMLVIEFAVRGVPVEGEVEVVAGGRILYSGPLPAEVQLPEPGNYTLVARLHPATPAVLSAAYTLHVYYAGEVEEPPRLEGWRVLVADRIVNETVVVYENRTVTVTETVTATAAPAHETPGKLMFALAAVGAAAIGFTAGALVAGDQLRRLSRRRSGEPSGDGELFEEG